MKELNFRTRKRGGGLRDIDPGYRLLIGKNNKIIFLIHGFNTNEKEARKSYSSFKRSFSRYSPDHAKQLVGVFWPSDGQIPIHKVFEYANIIQRAKASAGKISFYLKEANIKRRTPEIIFIGHSLGCLVILEILAGLYRTDLAKECKISIVLMAAAVPIKHIESDRMIKTAIDEVANRDKIVMYSKKDEVLKLPFKFGQAKAWDQSASEAIGLNGKPKEGVWTNRIDMGIFFYGHSDYWKELTTGSNISRSLKLLEERHIEKRGHVEERKFKYRQMIARA